MTTNITKVSNISNRKNKLSNIDNLPEFNSLEVSEKEIEHILSNLNNFPFRGIISKIAKKRGISTEAVWQSVKNHKNRYYIGIIKHEANLRLNSSNLS